MNRFRFWSRRAWLLHGYLLATLFLPPFPLAHSYWTDANHDGVKEEVGNPAEGDSWWSGDDDGDLLTNDLEVLFGSDPYSLDSDQDGLTDYVEFLYSQDALSGGTALPFDPWLWDTDGDGFSDFDEYYQLIQGYTPVVDYNNLPAGATWSSGTFYTYSDADGDGVINSYDDDPLNMDRDNDGVMNWNDVGYMDDANNGYVPPSDDPTPPADSDGDGIPDDSDPFPFGSYWYNSTEYAGTWSDSDGDGIPDPADSYPDDPTNGAGYNYNGTWFNGPWIDSDGDNIPDPVDTYPYDPYDGVGYYYNSTWYSGAWVDADGDGIPDPADAYPNDSDNGGYNYNGMWYSGSWADSDGDGIPDPADDYPNDPNNGSYYYNGNWYAGPWVDNDGDGIPNEADTYPDDPTNGMGFSYEGSWYYGMWMDSDNDGIPDQADTYPNDPYNGADFYYNGNWYYGAWADADEDGIPDQADSYPNDPTNGAGYNYNGIWYYGMWVDSDSDGIPDPADSYPYDANNGGYYYNNTWYPGEWVDSDGDGIPDPNDSYPFDANNDPYANSYNYNGTWYSGTWSDYDNDGVPDPADNWPADPDNGADSDGDGLTNYDERTQYGTDPYNVDSDGDMLDDFSELFSWHTNPLQPLTNPNQVYTDYYMVDQVDSDSDGIPDRIESFYGMNIYDPNDAQGDLDGDGYTNLAAYHNGWNFTAGLDRYDGDSDGIIDVLEDAWSVKYPGILSKTCFNDSVRDYDGDGVMNFEEVSAGLDPGSPNSRTSAVSDLQEWTWLQTLPATSAGSPWRVMGDADLDGISDGLQAFITAGTVPLLKRVSANDCDGDGMPDLWEHLYRLILRDASDVIDDPDGDGLTNLDEYRYGTNPLVQDTDNDHVNDAGNLYGTSIPPRTLHGQTTAYQPQQVADYTRTSGSGSGPFTAYADGEPEDSPADTPNVYIYQQPFWQSGDYPITDPASVQWKLLDEWEFKAVSGSSEHYHADKNIAPHYWDTNSNSYKQALEFSYTDYWFQAEVRMKVELSEAVANDRTFTFRVTNSEGDSYTVTKTIPGGKTTCPDPAYVSAKAPLLPDYDFASLGWVDIELVEDSPPDVPRLSFSSNDGAGSRYRKVSLAGVPIPDGKPQVQDESGERDEETYIDAYNRHLQHAVTDIYASDPSTLLPLSVRRDVTSESWSRSGGLRPSERADLPFGPCWTSNLCSFVRFETSNINPIQSAEVHDEQGATQRFLAEKDRGNWQSSREERSGVRTSFNSFDGLTLRKKFGTTCVYLPCGLTQTMPRDRIQEGDEEITYTYARLDHVIDRLGNRLVYEYDSDSLIPSRVYDPDRPGRQIYVMHAGGRVSAVRGPSGEEVLYNNTSMGLTRVMRGSGMVQYSYQNWIETKDSTTTPNSSTLDDTYAHYHTELSSITDERNNSYHFWYEFDHSMVDFSVGEDGSSPEQTVRLGMPMQVKTITQPDGGSVYLSGHRKIEASAAGDFSADSLATTEVSGIAGKFSYAFSFPNVYRPQFFGLGLDDDASSLTTTVTYTQMRLSSTAGTEDYVFNPDAMFALAKSTDLSGNIHSFFYEGNHDDPVTEIDALGHTKSFTYEPSTRVMSSMTDQTGVVTSYDIQPLTGLKRGETVKAADGTVKRQSTYEYNHPTFHGFMTKSTVDASTEDTAPPTVTHYTLGSGTLGWAKVTETTPTASGDVSTTTVHDLSGNKRSVIDGRGLVTNFDYDSHLRLTQVTHPDNSHKDLAYDAHGNLVRETNENGTATIHEYDVFNRRRKTTLDLNGNGLADGSYGTALPEVSGTGVTYSGDIVTTTTYNARNQVLTQTDPRGKLTVHTYDIAGRLIRTNDGGLLTTMEYGVNSGGSVFDSSGYKPTQITDPMGTLTTLTYDKMYRTIRKQVTYHEKPEYYVLQASADTALQTYQQSQAQTVTAGTVKAQAATALNHAMCRCDPVAAAAAVAAATAVLADADALLAVKTAARDQANQALLSADLAAQAYQNYLAAQTAHTTAAYNLSAGELIIQSATDANTTAQQNVITMAAALDEAVAHATNCAAETAAAQTIVDGAQVTVDNLNLSLSTAVGDEEMVYIYAQLAEANATLASASSALASAQSAQASADSAVVAATTDSSTAAAAAVDTANALGAANTSVNLSGLEAAVTQTQADEDSAHSSYDAAMQNAQEVGGDAQAELIAKTGLLNDAQNAMDSAQSVHDAAQTALATANADLQTAQGGAADPAVQAGLLAQLAAAQSTLDTATAALTAQISTEAADLDLSNAAQQAWEAVQPLLGDNAEHTASTSTDYDAAGRPTSVTDALERTTLTVYDVFGQIQSVTHPDGTSASTAYTHHGKPWQVTDELGNTTTTTYDAAGRAIAVQSPAVDGVSATHTTEYDAASNVIRVTDALGRETDSQYDERNRPVAVYAPTVWDAIEGEFVRPASTTTYDALGQVLTITDPQGNVTTKDYDAAGRNWRVVAPVPEAGMAAPTSTTAFDPGGLALTVTNPLGQTVTNTYDVHGRLLTTLDAEGITNTFGYDVAGNRTSVKDGKNQETIFAYDGLNRLTAQLFANGDMSTFAYNAVQKLSQTTPRGITTSYTYDLRDRVLTTSAPAHGSTPALSRTCTYDDAGHLLTVTEAGHEAASVAYTYDELGRVTAETSLGITHGYGYDLVGNRTHASYGTGRSVQTSYDALNRPELIAEGGRVTRYGYDLGGRAVMLVAGNGQASSNNYDNLGRLVDRTLFRTTGMSQSEVLAEFSWEHDLLGNVTRQLETWPGDANRSSGIRSTTMAYDDNNRLASETVVEDISDETPEVTTTSYTYDEANNRLQKSVTGGADPGVWHYTYNAANQLTSWEQRDTADSTSLRSASLEYDDAGNRTFQTVSITGGATGNGITPPPAASGTTSYQWDAQDRLSSVTLPNGETHSYDYDYRTRRIGTHKLISGVQQAMTAIVFAGGLSLAEYDSTTSALPATPTVEYTRGPDMGGGVGGMLYSLRSGTPKYSLSNGRGDIVAQADASATLTWTASYEAYGRRTKETGANQDKQRGNSKDEDPTGLLNEGFRYRDLETGVWLSRDPAGVVDGPNVYAYVVQNPWSHFDAHGLHWQSFSSLPSTQSMGQDFQRGEIEGQKNASAGIIGGFLKMVSKVVNTVVTKVGHGGGGDATIAHTNGQIDAAIDHHMEQNFGADVHSDNYKVGSGGAEIGSAVVAAVLVKESPATSAKNTQGQATVMMQELEGGPHVSVNIQKGDRSLHTEQVITDKANSTTIVPAKLENGPVQKVVLDVPDAEAAMNYQRSVLNKPMGTYDPKTNSCVTHVGDVLRAGGLPAGKTTREVGRYVRRSGQNKAE